MYKILFFIIFSLHFYAYSAFDDSLTSEKIKQIKVAVKKISFKEILTDKPEVFVQKALKIWAATDKKNVPIPKKTLYTDIAKKAKKMALAYVSKNMKPLDEKKISDEIKKIYPLFRKGDKVKLKYRVNPVRVGIVEGSIDFIGDTEVIINNTKVLIKDFRKYPIKLRFQPKKIDALIHKKIQEELNRLASKKNDLAFQKTQIFEKELLQKNLTNGYLIQKGNWTTPIVIVKTLINKRISIAKRLKKREDIRQKMLTQNKKLAELKAKKEKETQEKTKEIQLQKEAELAKLKKERETKEKEFADIKILDKTQKQEIIAAPEYVEQSNLNKFKKTEKKDYMIMIILGIAGVTVVGLTIFALLTKKKKKKKELMLLNNEPEPNTQEIKIEKALEESKIKNLEATLEKKQILGPQHKAGAEQDLDIDGRGRNPSGIITDEDKFFDGISAEGFIDEEFRNDSDESLQIENTPKEETSPAEEPETEPEIETKEK